MAAQVFDRKPRQDEKPALVDNVLEVSLADLVAPTDPLVPNGDPPSGRRELYRRYRLSTGPGRPNQIA
jgi:hypothetical protein